MKACIKLFKALPIKTKLKEAPTEELLKKTIKRGFVFAPEIIANYSNYDELIELVEKVFGITGEKVNASFHKSWKKVKEADIEQLVIEQWAHYLTTYGKKNPIEYLLQKGIEHLPQDFDVTKLYDTDYVYLPKEILSSPSTDINEVKLVIIKGLTKDELKDKLLKLLDSGIALKEDTIKDVTDVALFVDVNEEEIESIKNKEVRVILYNFLGKIPENPIEFLRYIVYLSTDSTLLIKSKDLIDKIKENKNIKIIKIFRDYEKQYGLEKLAEIFLRFKPLWLSFRTNRELKTIINRIRKLACTYHKPMREDYLNEITSKIKKCKKIDKDKLESELDRVNVWRKVRLLYALQYRTKDVKSIIYRIRNGKSYATDFYFGRKDRVKGILDTVLDSIVKDVSKNVKGKKIFIPDFINYSLPATEKQFTGNFPSGTYISIPQDMVVGVHWENVKQNRIDLDLSLINASGKFGWDAGYRNDEGSILFSGDITDAPKPKGAAELFYVEKQLKASFIMMLNYYNYDEEIKVPFKIIIAKEKVKNLKDNYMANPNNIISVTQTEISQKQKILGLLITTTKGSRFYFVETSIGNSITSRNSELAEHSRKYLMDFYQNSVELEDILLKAGALITDDKEADFDIDLSPENLEKDTILNLLVKSQNTAGTVEI